jgi:hypothetical protein
MFGGQYGQLVQSNRQDGSQPSTSASSQGAINPDEYLYPAVPDIQTVQRSIDEAHSRGFDPIGGKQLGKLEQTKTWIGSVDAHALFSSFGVKSTLVDFRSSSFGVIECA